MSTERRQHARVGFSKTLEVQCGGLGTWFTVFGVDVSAGGCGLISPVAMEPGEEILVSVPAAGISTLRATVRHVVRRTQSCELGVQFEEPLSEVEAETLAGAE